MNKILTLGYVPYGTGRHEPFNQVFPEALSVTPAMVLNKEVDAVVVWGGEDISPSMYGELPNRYTHAGATLSHRDRIERAIMRAAKDSGTPIIGVCRGAQMLCAFAGGKLIQHVENHHGSHQIRTVDGREMTTSSIHHQMMLPWAVDHKLIAWSSGAHSPVYFGEHNQMIEEATEHSEPEIVYFPQVKGLAIQGHPEFMDENCEFVLYCNELVREYLLQEEHSHAL